MVYDIMFYTEKNNITGMLLPIDFAIDFNSISWGFIFIGHKFGDTLINKFKLFYTNI